MGRPLYSTRYATSSPSAQSASSSNSSHCEKWTRGAAFDPDSDEYYERHAILEAFVDNTHSRGFSADPISPREAASSSSSSSRRSSATATDIARSTASATRRTPQQSQDRPHVVTASPSSNSQYPIIPSPTSPSSPPVARRGSLRPDMWRTFTEMEQMWQEAMSRHDAAYRPSGQEEHHTEPHSTPASGASPIDIPTRTPARHHTHQEQTPHRNMHGSGWNHSPMPWGTPSPSSATPRMVSWPVNSAHSGRHVVPASPSPRDSSVSTHILHPTHMAPSLLHV